MRIDHVGIIVRDLEATLQVYRDLFGDSIKIILEHGPRWNTAIIKTESGKIELIEPLDPDSPPGKFMAKKGEGLHHLALEVNDVQESLNTAARLGLSVIDEHPRKGSEERLIGFIHPRSFTGVLLEFSMPDPEIKKV